MTIPVEKPMPVMIAHLYCPTCKNPVWCIQGIETEKYFAVCASHCRDNPCLVTPLFDNFSHAVDHARVMIALLA